MRRLEEALRIELSNYLTRLPEYFFDALRRRWWPKILKESHEEAIANFSLMRVSGSPSMESEDDDTNRSNLWETDVITPEDGEMPDPTSYITPEPNSASEFADLADLMATNSAGGPTNRRHVHNRRLKRRAFQIRIWS